MGQRAISSILAGFWVTCLAGTIWSHFTSIIYQNYVVLINEGQFCNLEAARVFEEVEKAVI